MSSEVAILPISRKLIGSQSTGKLKISTIREATVTRFSRFALVLPTILLALAAIAPAQADVTLLDMGTINGRQSIGTGVNAAGDAAGFSFVTGTIGEPNGPPAEPFIAHAVLFSGGVLTNLGALEGFDTCSPLGCESRGVDINDAGWIAGWNDGDGGPVPLVWLPQAIPGYAAGFNLLPRLAPGRGAFANALNNTGLVVGRSTPDGIGPRAVSWTLESSGPALADLGTLRADGQGYGTAYDVNDLGQIVGDASGDTFMLKPFLFLPEPACGLPAGMNDLMPNGAEPARALAINASGEVAGELDLGVPWIWLPAPAHGLPAGLSMLALPREILAFFPARISDAGQIVGQAFVLTNPHTRDYIQKAAMWRAGRWTILDTVLPPHTPWELVYAEGIVHTGKTTRITGSGLISGLTDINGITPASHGYVLSVTCTGDLNDDGDVDEQDLAIQRGHMGEAVPPGTSGDMNGDGTVDARDIPLLASQIGQPCL